MNRRYRQQKAAAKQVSWRQYRHRHEFFNDYQSKLLRLADTVKEFGRDWKKVLQVYRASCSMARYTIKLERRKKLEQRKTHWKHYGNKLPAD